MLKEAADAFEKAARDPRYRFRSAQSLGRLFRKDGMLTEAVEWLDIASEAPAPSIDEHRSALYELADALEATGEHTRALVVLLDLVAEQGDYRDARARIERLSRVQAIAGDAGRLLRQLLFVAYLIEAGLVLLIGPWSRLWDRNAFVQMAATGSLDSRDRVSSAARSRASACCWSGPAWPRPSSIRAPSRHRHPSGPTPPVDGRS